MIDDCNVAGSRLRGVEGVWASPFAEEVEALRFRFGVRVCVRLGVPLLFVAEEVVEPFDVGESIPLRKKNIFG